MLNDISAKNASDCITLNNNNVGFYVDKVCYDGIKIGKKFFPVMSFSSAEIAFYTIFM